MEHLERAVLAEVDPAPRRAETFRIPGPPRRAAPPVFADVAGGEAGMREFPKMRYFPGAIMGYVSCATHSTVFDGHLALGLKNPRFGRRSESRG
jgi:hypothetical protein